MVGKYHYPSVPGPNVTLLPRYSELATKSLVKYISLTRGVCLIVTEAVAEEEVGSSFFCAK